MRCLLAAITMLSLAWAASAQTTLSFSGGTAVVSVAGLHVSGNQILNNLGQVVPLRGVDQDGTEYECISGGVFDGPATLANIAVLQTWAINIVRLPINEQCWLGINSLPSGISSSTYQTTIINYINLLTANNIAVIFDLQWAAPGTTQATMLTPMPDSDHAGAFWTSAATALMGNSSVIFDLFNEPYPDSNQDTTAAWTCLSVGGTCPGVSYSAASMQSLVNAIRTTGATNIIMVPGVQFTNTLSQWLTYKPTDSLNNIAASWHSYATEGCNTSTCWNSQVKPVANSVPLIVGEIGENDCQGIYIDVLMPWLDANAGSRYLGWAWNTYNCSSFPALISDYTTGTPTAFGIDFRNHLLALAGRPIPTPPVIPFFAPYLTGTWVNVTPSNASPDGMFSCGNFGTSTPVVDPLNQSNIWMEYDCQGLWKSTDYGATWTGPVNTGTNAALVTDCPGQIGGGSGGTGNPPIIYMGCIRGSGIGFWVSTDGAVNWTNKVITVAPPGRQDVTVPVVDPYNSQHVIISAHELDFIYETYDGGNTWASLPLDTGMLENGGTAIISFIDTGVPATTATTILFIAQGTGGFIGTWRTTNSGTSWTQVDTNEHPHGPGQIYQPDTGGTIYMPGIYSAHGWGVLKSTDYGVTWTHVGNTNAQSVVFGTPNAIYGEYSWACGCPVDPGFQYLVPPNAGGTWTNLASPSGMANGPAGTVTVFDGTNWIIVGGNFQAGTWRYVEDSFGLGIGAASKYIASGQPDWTVYYPDTPSSTLATDVTFFAPYTTGATITGTPDPMLYAAGRYGVFGNWTINVPNGNYQVTLGIAPVDVYTGTNPNAGQFGQDQTIQSNVVANCYWSSDAGCRTVAAPAVDAVGTVTYSVSVFNQMLEIQTAASNGGGRKTMLNTIKVVRVP